MQRARGTPLNQPPEQQSDGEPVDTESAGSGTPAPPPAQRRTTLLFAAVALLAVVADQVTKAIALRELTPGEPVELVGSALRLNLIRNSGAAFSIGAGFTLVLTLIATGVVIVVLRLSRRLRSKVWTVALGLLLGGALGNLFDRFFRDPGPLRGHVVDFLELPRWPVFNLADTAVVCAAVLMVLQTFRGVSLDGARDRVPENRG